MPLDLYCPNCRRDLRAFSEPFDPDVLERISEEGPWAALGDGATFEDTLYRALAESDAGRCPECDAVASVNEESLGRLTMEVLARW